MILVICGIYEIKQMSSEKKKEANQENSLFTIENNLLVIRGEMFGGMGSIGDRD